MFFSKLKCIFGRFAEHPELYPIILLGKATGRLHEERIFIQKEYNSEYVIGRFLDEDKYTVIDNRPLCLSELISTDLFTLLNTHITVLEWLRKRDFAGVRYDYPWED